MVLHYARIVALDTASLAKVSQDYWSQDACRRGKARSFVARLQHLGVFITLTATHVAELLRHRDEQIAQERLRFLRSLPLIAWLRPYDRSWHAGSVADLFDRELNAVVHRSAKGWRAIIDEVRADLWETGLGSELFLGDDAYWADIREQAIRLHGKETYIASMARTDVGQLKDVKLGDLVRWRTRSKEERDTFMPRFAEELQGQLDRHGDQRFHHSHEAAIAFARSIVQDVEAIEEMGGSTVQGILHCSGVPGECLLSEMTLGEVGELAVYAKRLKMSVATLRPQVRLTMRDVPVNALPSYVLERKLAAAQNKEQRVSGSNLGDRHIAPLVFYTDGIEVDKRTYEFLGQVHRNDLELGRLMGGFFRCPDYSQIPTRFEE